MGRDLADEHDLDLPAARAAKVGIFGGQARLRRITADGNIVQAMAMGPLAERLITMMDCCRFARRQVAASLAAVGVADLDRRSGVAGSMMRLWKRRLPTRLPALLVLGLLGACTATTEPYRQRPGESRALALMRANGYTRMRDSETPAVANAPGPLDPTLTNLGFTTGAMLANGLAGVAQGVAFASLGTPEQDDVRFARVLAFVPKSEATTEPEARALVYRHMLAAYEQVLPQMLGETRWQVIEWTYGGKDYAQIQLAGGPCPAKARLDVVQTECTIGGLARDQATLRERDAPDFLGSYPGWTTTSYQGKVLMPPWLQERATLYARFPELETYERVSALMPPWMFIYAGPLTPTCPDGGKCVFVGHPLVLDHGQRLYFVPATG